MTNKTKKNLPAQEQELLLQTLSARFEKNRQRHKDLDWKKILAKLKAAPDKLWSLYEMEQSGGEPDVLQLEGKSADFIFIDCAAETPAGRRSLCYDREALNARKEHKPAGSAMEMAAAMGITILSEALYRQLQQVGKFDTKTSSWIQTPDNIRKLGGALFCDRRYDTVFVYHNGAESYYAARGFRGWLPV
ncbi:MAG: DUF4256 domain-containing protein [Ferruginibacter sp.]